MNLQPSSLGEHRSDDPRVVSEEVAATHGPGVPGPRGGHATSAQRIVRIPSGHDSGVQDHKRDVHGAGKVWPDGSRDVSTANLRDGHCQGIGVQGAYWTKVEISFIQIIK